MGKFKYGITVLAIGLMSAVLAAPPVAKSKIPLGGVTIGMSEADLLKKAKKSRKKLAGPGKGLISHKEMVQVKEYVVDRDRQLETISGAKTQTFMLLDGKIIAVKLHFKRKSNMTSYLKKFEKAGFEKESDKLYNGTVDVGPYAGRKVRVQIDTITVKRKSTYDVIISCLEVLGKGVTAETLMDAQKGGGVRKKNESPQSRRGMGGVL